MKGLDNRTDVESEWVSLMWEARQLGLSVKEVRTFLQAAQQEETEKS